MHPSNERKPISEKQRTVGTAPDHQLLTSSWLSYWLLLFLSCFVDFFLPAPVTTQLWLLSGPWNGPWACQDLWFCASDTEGPAMVNGTTVSSQAGTQIRLCRNKSQFANSSTILSQIPALPRMQALTSPVLHNKLKPNKFLIKVSWKKIFMDLPNKMEAKTWGACWSLFGKSKIKPHCL